METLEQGVKYLRHWRRAGVFIVNYFISCSSAFIGNFEQVNAGCDRSIYTRGSESHEKKNSK